LQYYGTNVVIKSDRNINYINVFNVSNSYVATYRVGGAR